ncbi:MAG TPA: hypothetical protein VNZ45_02620 [Bacteroidia bacterium]|jgi:hypothetical protein|nr:hypothetical protein [Bacteroidia bacterium]
MPYDFSQFAQQPQTTPRQWNQTTGGWEQSNGGGGGWKEWLFGSPEKIQQVNNYTPLQQSAFQTQLMEALNGLFNGSKFDLGPQEKQAVNQFQTETVPTIAERFSALGSGGSQSSSAFGNVLGRAGADLNLGLAGQRQNALQNMLQSGLTQQFDTKIHHAQSGFLGNAWNSAQGTANEGIKAYIKQYTGGL